MCFLYYNTIITNKTEVLKYYQNQLQYYAVDKTNPSRYNFSLLNTAFDILHSDLAQPVEQLTVNQWVAGSSPAVGAILLFLIQFSNHSLFSIISSYFFVSVYLRYMGLIPAYHYRVMIL